MDQGSADASERALRRLLHPIGMDGEGARIRVGTNAGVLQLRFRMTTKNKQRQKRPFVLLPSVFSLLFTMFRKDASLVRGNPQAVLTPGSRRGYACANIVTLLATSANPVVAQLTAELSREGSVRSAVRLPIRNLPVKTNLKVLPDGGQIIAWSKNRCISLPESSRCMARVTRTFV